MSEITDQDKRNADCRAAILPRHVICSPNLGEVDSVLLKEPHPTKRLEFKRESVPAPRWSLTWSALERYVPKDAETLAKLRESRERGKAEREERKWASENPLLAWSEAEQLGSEEEARGR